MTGIGTCRPLLHSGSEKRSEKSGGALVLLARTAYLVGVAAFCELLQGHVCQAQVPQVDFSGIKISVESRSPVGAGSVAIQFGGEKFLTTEDQAGRSVALRLVRNPEHFKESGNLLPSIVSAAVKSQDSQILAEVVDRALSTGGTTPLNSEERWSQIVETPLGQQLVADAVSRGATQYSEGTCLASLVLYRCGTQVRLSERVSSACLAFSLDSMISHRLSDARFDLSDKRIQDVRGAFQSADPQALENADLLARSLSQIQGAKTVESYLSARSELSRSLTERGAPYDSAVIVSSFDDSFLEQSIVAGAFARALSLVPYLSFDRRTQRTHEAILKALQAVGPDAVELLRQPKMLEGLLQFAERDTEIADALQHYLSLAITRMVQREDGQAAIELLHRIKSRAEPMSRRLESSVLSAISTLLGRAEFESATRLSQVWGGTLPLSLRTRWWLLNARVVLWLALFGGVALCTLILRRRRALSGHVGERQSNTSHLQWPAGYEEAMRQVGLTPGISIAEIKQAYRTAIKREHPDLNPDASAQQHAKFRDLVANFERVIELHQHIR